MTTALVTGGNGFAGSHLCALLRARAWEVVALGRTPRDTPELRSVAFDLVRDPGLDDLLDSIGPEVVFHLAGPRVRTDPVELVVSDIVESIRSLAIAIRRVGRPTRVVLAGSSAQYGNVPRASNPIREDEPFLPVGAYGHAKVAAESVARALLGDGPAELIPVRPFNHIGPGEPGETVAGALAARVAAVVHGTAARVAIRDLEAVRDLTDVRDIAQGYLALAESGVPGIAYNLCSGRGVSVAELASSLLGAASLDESVLEVMDHSPGGVQYQVGSPERVLGATGWRAEIPLGRTVSDMLAAIGVGR